MEDCRHRDTVVIPVKLLVDEEEPSRQELWEKRLRARIDAASDILEKHCFVRFEVVATGTWQSANTIKDFDNSFLEFSRKADPAPARLAIGFTSQYQFTPGFVHLGGTRGPLDSHILMREWSRHASENERLELLLHEMGHFLGAVHSPEVDSVMRVLLADKKARARSFEIRFDPLNTLAMCLVSDELRLDPKAVLANLHVGTQIELYRLYQEIAKTLPKDASAPHFMELLDHSRLEPLVMGGQLVVKAIVSVAERNAQLPLAGTVLEGLEFRLEGDALGQLYAQRGAGGKTRNAGLCRAGIPGGFGDRGRPIGPIALAPPGRSDLRATGKRCRSQASTGSAGKSNSARARGPIAALCGVGGASHIVGRADRRIDRALQRTP